MYIISNKLQKRLTIKMLIHAINFSVKEWYVIRVESSLKFLRDLCYLRLYDIRHLWVYVGPWLCNFPPSYKDKSPAGSSVGRNQTQLSRKIITTWLYLAVKHVTLSSPKRKMPKTLTTIAARGWVARGHPGAVHMSSGHGHGLLVMYYVLLKLNY